jgi:glutamate N-acetyltransferase/amino-acid N-acetyltransferase
MHQSPSTKTPRQGVTAPLGFKAAGIHCGIKKAGLLDLALVVSKQSGPIAGVFTRNQIVAAPVILNRLYLRRGRGRAIIVNSGNANACTGPAGMTTARRTAQLVATLLGIHQHEVFVGSTGVIGRPLPFGCLKAGIPKLIEQLDVRGGLQAARAIMTTDLRPKQVAVQAQIGGQTVTIGGMAKGSGMIHPNMATMLGYLTTDAAITKAALQRALTLAVDNSFNCISVDGDTSTNDTVLCLANGLATNRPIAKDTSDFHRFVRLLTEACQTLALTICRDGEGVTKVVKIDVSGTDTAQQATQIARTVATSNLVKTALFGEDANWGRVMAAIGRAGVPIVPRRISIWFDGAPMVKNGVGLGSMAEKRIAQVFKKKEFTISIRLGTGRHRSHMWTTDLSYDYVRINASYRS